VTRAAGAGRDGMRASDADRDRVAGTLAQALAEGRLSTEEHGARLDAAFAARTCAELDAIVGDLPGGVAQDLTMAAAGPPERRQSWIAGIADRAAARRLQRQEVSAVRRERGRAMREARRRGQRQRRARRQPRRGR
jgi:hypothetical protein